MFLMEKTSLNLANQSKRAGWMLDGASQHGIYLSEFTRVLGTDSQYFSIENWLFGVPELIELGDADSV